MKFATEPGAFGTFGDYIGGALGAFTGLLSVIFLYFTYSKQLEIYSEQKRQTEQQQFEQTFFHLLDNFINLREHLKNEEERSEGLAYLHSVRLLIEKDIDRVCKEKDSFNVLNNVATRNKIEEVYKTAFISESDQLGHYFRSLYHLLKYIEEHCPKDVKKKMYFDLVQAQMNTDELYLTCLNGISSYGRKKLRPLLNDSSFLENLAIDENESIRQLVYFFYPKTKQKDPNGVRKNVILVSGTEGTRKGELAKILISEHLPARVTSIQAMLIRANKSPYELIKGCDTLKYILETTMDPDDIYVVNCSFCELQKDGRDERIPSTVYENINPVAVIYLHSPIDYLIHSVKHDDKVSLDEERARLYQQDEENAALEYAGMKEIPLYKFDTKDMPKVVDKIRGIVAAFD